MKFVCVDNLSQQQETKVQSLDYNVMLRFTSLTFLLILSDGTFACFF